MELQYGFGSTFQNYSIPDIISEEHKDQCLEPNT